VDIKQVENPEMSATIIAESIVGELEKRASYKRTMRRYCEMVMNVGGKGIKIQCKGRLGGAEIARASHIEFGKLPLQTLRSEIDYGTATAHLTKGTIGVKVWIYKGEKFNQKESVVKSPERKGDTKNETNAKESKVS